MNLIRISDSVVINADKVSAVEIKKIRGGKSLTLVVDGKSYVCELDAQEILKDLIKSGIDLSSQFFAG